MNQLRCCEGCSRHVLLSERECPFCRRELAPLPERVLPKLPAGLSRAQRLTLAAAMAGQALTACAETTDGVAIPIYGAPVAGSVGQAPQGGSGASGKSAAGRGGAGMTGGAGRDAGFAVPVYGVPIAGQPSPVKDAAPVDEDGGAQDAGRSDAGQMIVPPYGLPPMPVPVYGAPIPIPSPKR
jgi:hypothetical protein